MRILPLFSNQSPGAVPLGFSRATGFQAVGLFAIIVAHWPADLTEPLLYGLEDGFIENEGFSESVGNRLFGSVIHGRAETARGDQDVRPFPAKRELLIDILILIGNRIIAVQVMPR